MYRIANKIIIKKNLITSKIFSFLCDKSNKQHINKSYIINQQLTKGYEIPTQAFFLIDKKRFKTITAPILVR